MTGYEKSDVRFSAIAKAFGALAVLLACVALGAALALGRWSNPGADGRRRWIFAEPRLQSDPAADLRRLLAEEDENLSSYAWVDRSRGAIRLPIERAMALLLRRGLPVRAAAARSRP